MYTLLFDVILVLIYYIHCSKFFYTKFIANSEVVNINCVGTCYNSNVMYTASQEGETNSWKVGLLNIH